MAALALEGVGVGVVVVEVWVVDEAGEVVVVVWDPVKVEEVSVVAVVAVVAVVTIILGERRHGQMRQRKRGKMERTGGTLLRLEAKSG